MKVEETGIPGLKVIHPKVIEDDRGYFYESYNQRAFEAAGIEGDFVQDNQSKSNYGVLRGLHYQLNPHAQAKLVRVLDGKVLDVVVDIRQGSPTYKKQYAIELSAENKTQLYIPRGFAHGFVVLSKAAVFFYKCDNFYNKESERGIRFDESEFGIDWQIDLDKAILSEKDQNLPGFAESEHNFTFEA